MQVFGIVSEVHAACSVTYGSVTFGEVRAPPVSVSSLVTGKCQRLASHVPCRLEAVTVTDVPGDRKGQKPSKRV